MLKSIFICTAAAVLATGCNRDNVKVYHVENEDAIAQPASAPATTTTAPAETQTQAAASVPAMISAMPTTMPAGLPVPDKSNEPQLKYTLPEGWQEKAPSEMRVASFGISENVKTADVSVIPLSGMGGGDFANINRWRGQVGLQALADDDLQKLAEKVEIAGQPADLFDIGGTTQRIIGAILHHDDATWFFKITGDTDLVEREKINFVTFLKSFQFGGLPTPSTMDLSKLPAGHPALPGMDSTTPAPAMPTDTANQPQWTIPQDWQVAALSQFLVAKFSIAGTDGAQAAVNVSQLDGDGGGLAANVNRWRGQLGLTAADETEFSKIISSLDASGDKGSLVDFNGTNPQTGKSTRLVGAIVPHGGQTWFYKLMGDASVVAAQKDAFIKFVQSAKYPDAH